MINRNYYLKQLIEKKHSSKIKIVTGLRRSGKSYLLGVIFRQHLIENGVKEEQIIVVELDDDFGTCRNSRGLRVEIIK